MFAFAFKELLEVNSKFCAKLQKSLEDSVANGDEVHPYNYSNSPLYKAKGT